MGNQYLIRVSALVHVLSLCILHTYFIRPVTTAICWEGQCSTWYKILAHGPGLIFTCSLHAWSKSIIPWYDQQFEKHLSSAAHSRYWIPSNAIMLFSMILDKGKQEHKIASGAGTLGDNAEWASGIGSLENSLSLQIRGRKWDWLLRD